MSVKPTIRVEAVSKKFNRRLRQAVLRGVADTFRDAIGLDPDRGCLRPGEFWALREVSFDLSPGGCLGVIGANGSGKSTLLKLLSGILRPDSGRIVTRGRIGALIEVGAGFHPLLTGRENIYVNGSILGMPRSEIDRHFDAIVDFADIAEFLDTPVKFYSSGMYVRLGFAIAAHLSPDALLIDEVLAVGDVGFRAKCYDVIYRFIREKAVVLVSHNMMHIARTCNRLLVLAGGKAALFEDVSEGIRQYLHAQALAVRTIHENGAHLQGLMVTGGAGEAVIDSGGRLLISFTVEFTAACANVRIVVLILDRSLTPVAAAHIDDNGIPKPTSRSYRLSVPAAPLFPGSYTISLAAFQPNPLRQLLWHNAVHEFQVDGDAVFLNSPVRLIGNWSVDDAKICNAPTDI